MPDLSAMLDETVDDMVDLVIPEGYWRGVIKGAKLYDTGRDGEPLTDKNGDEYARAVLYVQCNEPIDGVDDGAATAYIEGNGPAETLARYNAFIRGRRDIKRLTTQLEQCGALTQGRGLKAIFAELKGADVPVQVLVEHEEYEGDIQTNATELAPVS